MALQGIVEMGYTQRTYLVFGAVVYRLGHLVFNQVSRVRLSAALLNLR